MEETCAKRAARAGISRRYKRSGGLPPGVARPGRGVEGRVRRQLGRRVGRRVGQESALASGELHAPEGSEGRGRSPGRPERRIHAPLDLAAALYYMSHCSREGQRLGHRCAPQFPTESSPLPSPKDTTSWNLLARAAQTRGARRFHAARKRAPLLEGARGLRGRMLRGTDVEARKLTAAKARTPRSGSSRYNPPDLRAAREGEWNRATRLGGPS
jgi:hypothetical protein